MRREFLYRSLLARAVIQIAICCQAAAAQTTAPNQGGTTAACPSGGPPLWVTRDGSNSKPEAFADAENLWQSKPIDIRMQRDTVTPFVRDARSSYWKGVFDRWRSEQEESAKAGVLNLPAVGNFSPVVPEIPSDSDATWVVAKFTGYLVIPTDSEYRGLYDEEAFTILQVIWQPRRTNLAAGDQFEVDQPGGRLLTPHGEVVSEHLSPRQFSPQPGHTYLFRLVNDSAPFRVMDRTWDVSDGKLTPDDPRERMRQMGGASKMCGLPLPEAVQYIEDKLKLGSSDR